MACQCGHTTTVEREETLRPAIASKGADCGCGCTEAGCTCGCGEVGRSEVERHIVEIRRRLAELRPVGA